MSNKTRDSASGKTMSDATLRKVDRTGNVVPISDATLGKPVLGNVEGIFGTELRGWFLPERAPAERESAHGSNESTDELLLLADGLPVERIRLTHSRPDVHEAFGRGAQCGFRVDLSNLPKNRVHELQVAHEPSGYDFRNFSVKYCAKVSERVGQLRSLVYPEWYRVEHGLEKLSNAEAVEHFVSKGIFENIDPCIWFSDDYFRTRYPGLVSDDLPSLLSYLENERAGEIKPSPAFDPQAYLRKYPDLANTVSPLRHFLAYGRKEGRNPAPSTIPDRIVNELNELAELEPALVGAKSGLNVVVRHARTTGTIFLPTLAKARFGSGIDAIICVPWVNIGGADLIATYALRAYQERFGVDKVLLIVTDRECVDVPGWLPHGTRLLCLDAESDFENIGEKVESLHSIIGTLSPSTIVNANSYACWELYRQYGSQLSTALDLYAYLFCFDHDLDGSMVGYICSYVPDLVDVMTGFFCDNADVVNRIRKIYGFADAAMEKFHTVYTPAPPSVATTQESKQLRSDAILWIGRISRQKRPELLIEVARQMPNERFVAYGPSGDSPAGDTIMNGELFNVEYRGVYDDINELDFSEFRCLLNTSAWEGLPTLLIQTMAAGLPIVTTNAGGISELVDEMTGWVVPVDAEVSTYVAAVNEVAVRSELAAERALRGRALVERRHCWSSFCATLEASGAFSTSRKGGNDGSVRQDRSDPPSGEAEHRVVSVAHDDDRVPSDPRAFQLHTV